MHPFTLIEQLWWAGPVAAVAVGVVLGASPLAWPIVATAVGVRAGASGGETARPGRTLVALGGGITVVYATLGLLAGELERVISEVFGAWAGVMAALGVGHTLTLLLLGRLSLNVVREVARRPATIQRTGGALLLLSAAFFAYQAVIGGPAVAPTLP